MLHLVHFHNSNLEINIIACGTQRKCAKIIFTHKTTNGSSKKLFGEISQNAFSTMQNLRTYRNEVSWDSRKNVTVCHQKQH
ncbi:Hypothetical predicted protein [Octopus vulgaris]|uniref:Uncharacterized protein n=1 Tax=Octopus vulgaris TaxID=6645 RepID=A0AA36B9E7_OCTVU|nr:Hypothetical predicted protein [Octopus vulgaris]